MRDSKDRFVEGEGDLPSERAGIGGIQVACMMRLPARSFVAVKAGLSAED
jgi:hypothetical protein